MSDHCVLKFTCQLHNTTFTSNNKNKLKLDRYRLAGISNAPDNSVDETWGKFAIIMCDGIKQFIPIRKLHILFKKIFF